MWSETSIRILKAIGAVALTCLTVAPIMAICLFAEN